MSRDTENFSMYSLMSTRIRACSSAKRNLARARASSRRLRWPVDSGVAQVAQMPLEWLGYEVDYLNVNQQELPGSLDTRYAAVILDRYLDLPRNKEAAVADYGDAIDFADLGEAAFHALETREAMGMKVIENAEAWLKGLTPPNQIV